MLNDEEEELTRDQNLLDSLLKPHYIRKVNVSEPDTIGAIRVVTNKLQSHLIHKCKLKSDDLEEALKIAGEYQDIMLRTMLMATSQALQTHRMCNEERQVPIRVKSIRPEQSGIRICSLTLRSSIVLSMEDPGVNKTRVFQSRVVVLKVKSEQSIEDLKKQFCKMNVVGVLTPKIPNRVVEEWMTQHMLYIIWRTHKVN